MLREVCHPESSVSVDLSSLRIKVSSKQFDPDQRKRVESVLV
jgi:hypothetical protein